MEQKLIPFDLERALAGDKVITRKGLKVLELHLFKHDDSFNPLAALTAEASISYHSTAGKFRMMLGDDDHDDDLDLFMAPIEKEYWMVTYIGTATQTLFSSGCLLSSEQQAQEWIKRNVNLQFGQPQIHKLIRLE